MSETAMPAEASGDPFGTYSDVGVRRVGMVGCASLTALGGAAAMLGLLGEVPWLDAAFATLTGVVGGAALWLWGVRPRLEVSRSGLVVVNPVRTMELEWAEIDSFDSRHSLAVHRRDGTVSVVAALPASGLRRIITASPGRVDRLAITLNAYLATRSAPGATPARTSIETPEGRRDLRVMAGLAVAGVVVAAVVRHLVG